MITAQERHPGKVLLDPGASAFVADLEVDLVGLTEEPLGITQGSAEHLGETARPQRLPEMLGVAQHPQPADGVAQVASGGDQVALHLGGRATQPHRLGKGEFVLRFGGRHQQLLEHVAGTCQRSALDRPLRQQQHRCPSLQIRRVEFQGTLDQLHPTPVRTLQVCPLGGLHEQAHGSRHVVVRHARRGADLAHQLHRRGHVVGTAIDVRLAVPEQVAGDARVALGTDLFGERPVRHLTHHVAAERPVRTVANQQPLVVEHVQIVRVEHLADLGGERPQRPDPSSRAEDRGVVQQRPLRRR